ncbi:hypothetical protein [Murinocardiopsis flavida]|nr:hypothetical protein [Murinocardiopsis flavida]
MDYRILFNDVQKRPKNYGLDGSFLQFTVFVNGCDAGNDWGLLLGFNHWLALRLDCEASPAWPVLVLRSAFPDEQRPTLRAALSPEQDTQASEEMFRLLGAFLEQRTGASVSSIIARYENKTRNRADAG